MRVDTPRLTLRPFAADDWEDFRQLSIDWQAAPGPAFDKWPTSAEASQASVQHMATHEQYVAVCLRASGKVIGLLGDNGTDAEGRLDLGHVILSGCQDNDLDREALEAMVRHCFGRPDVRAVVTHNAPDHAAQLAPLRSLGLVNCSPAQPGELLITRAEWEAR